MSRPAWDAMKLERDGHTLPVGVCADPRPNPEPGMAWRVRRGEDGMPESMAWLGPRCTNQSPGGWWCQRPEGHEGRHGATYRGWVTMWHDGETETHVHVHALTPDSEPREP